VFPFSAANHASFSAVQFRAAFACGEWSCRAMPCSLHAVPCRPMPCHAWCCASTGAAGGRAAVDFEHRCQWHVRPRRLLHHLGPDPRGKPPLAPDCVGRPAHLHRSSCHRLIGERRCAFASALSASASLPQALSRPTDPQRYRMQALS
jgi:hypothetical protein